MLTSIKCVLMALTINFVQASSTLVQPPSTGKFKYLPTYQNSNGILSCNLEIKGDPYKFGFSGVKHDLIVASSDCS